MITLAKKFEQGINLSIIVSAKYILNKLNNKRDKEIENNFGS